VRGDGNCLFASVVGALRLLNVELDQPYLLNADALRKEVVKRNKQKCERSKDTELQLSLLSGSDDRLNKNPKRKPYTNCDDYLKYMSTNGKFGGHTEYDAIKDILSESYIAIELYIRKDSTLTKIKGDNAIAAYVRNYVRLLFTPDDRHYDYLSGAPQK
jgi:hypothetical protein